MSKVKKLCRKGMFEAVTKYTNDVRDVMKSIDEFEALGESDDEFLGWHYQSYMEEMIKKSNAAIRGYKRWLKSQPHTENHEAAYSSRPFKRDDILNKFGIGSDIEHYTIQSLIDCIDNNDHTLINETDLLTTEDILIFLKAYTPDNHFVQDYDKVKLRRFGTALAKSREFASKNGCYYIPVDPYIKGDKPSNRRKRIWILRNEKKYEKLGPADMFREYVRQYTHAQEMYRAEENSQLEQPPSFL